MTEAEQREDHYLSWELCVAAMRELGVRAGQIAPIDDDECRQAAEGVKPFHLLDCVRRAPQE